MNPTLDYDTGRARRLAIAVAVSLALHALLVASGMKWLHFMPASIAPDGGSAVGTLAVLVRGAPAPVTAVAPSPRAPTSTASTIARPQPVDAPPHPSGIRVPVEQPAPPAPPPVIALQVAIIVDAAERLPPPFDEALRQDAPDAVRGDLAFEPPLALRYPIERMGENAQRQNRALIVAQPDGTARILRAEFDDPVFVDEVQKALDQTRALPAPGGAADRERWTLFVFWLERVAVEAALVPPEPAARVTP